LKHIRSIGANNVIYKPLQKIEKMSKKTIKKLSVLAIIIVSLTSFNGRYNYSKEFRYHFDMRYDLVENTGDVKIWHRKTLNIDESFGMKMHINQWLDTNSRSSVSQRKLRKDIKFRMDSILNSIN